MPVLVLRSKNFKQVTLKPWNIHKSSLLKVIMPLLLKSSHRVILGLPSNGARPWPMEGQKRHSWMNSKSHIFTNPLLTDFTPCKSFQLISIWKTYMDRNCTLDMEEVGHHVVPSLILPAHMRVNQGRLNPLEIQVDVQAEVKSLPVSEWSERHYFFWNGRGEAYDRKGTFLTQTAAATWRAHTLTEVTELF